MGSFAKQIERFRTDNLITILTIVDIMMSSDTYAVPILNPSAHMWPCSSPNAHLTMVGTYQSAGMKISAMGIFVKLIERFRTDDLIMILTIADTMIFSAKRVDRNQIILLGVIGRHGVSVQRVVVMVSSKGAVLVRAVVAD